jgi:hypothetical protein
MSKDCNAQACVNNCDQCPALCCQYISVEVDTPVGDDAAADHIRWFLAHSVSVFFEDNGWYILVSNPCLYLDANNRCSIYENRMNICRNFSNDNCEFLSKWEPELLFKSVEEWDRYWAEQRGATERRGA